MSCVSRLSSNYKKSDTKVSATIKKKTNQVPSSSTIVSVAEAVSVSASVSIAADSDSDLRPRDTRKTLDTQTDRQSVSSPTRLTSAAQVLKPPTKLGKFRRSGEKETKSTAICLTADKTVKTGYHGTISYIYYIYYGLFIVCTLWALQNCAVIVSLGKSAVTFWLWLWFCLLLGLLIK